MKIIWKRVNSRCWYGCVNGRAMFVISRNPFKLKNKANYRSRFFMSYLNDNLSDLLAARIWSKAYLKSVEKLFKPISK